MPTPPVSRTLSQDPKVLDSSMTGRQGSTAVRLSAAQSYFIPGGLPDQQVSEMPWGSALMGHVHTPSVVSVYKTS